MSINTVDYANQLLAEIEHLRKMVQALAAENLTSRNAVQAFCDVVQSNTDAICEELGADNVRLILDAMRATGNMPATDAILREVGARAVDLHSKDQREQIGNKRKNDAASAYASREAERFAALIRAGEVQP